MVAANCISMLEQRAPVAVRPPEPADYALIDLASDETFLARLYKGMGQEAIAWWSLFEDTSLQPVWESGPILVDLRAAPLFRRELSELAAVNPVGIFLLSGLQPQEIRRAACAWVTGAVNSQGRLLRFYDPRVFAPLLCVLPEKQRLLLLSLARTWFWHDGHCWRQSSDGSPENPDPAVSGGTISPGVEPSQLESLPVYRLAAEAQGLSRHYGSVLPETGAPAVWVLNRLREAVASGVSGRAALEMWLRLAITRGEGFYRKAPCRDILARNDLTTKEKLRVMETESEAGNASL